MTRDEAEQLGEVKVPSGSLVIADLGELGPEAVTAIGALAASETTFALDEQPGAIVDGLPTDRPLRVLARRMPDGPHDDRWSALWIECLADTPVARSEKLGPIGSSARFVLLDRAALADWTSDKSMDGEADVLFTGKGTEAVARELRAQMLRPNYERCGWLDLPLDEAAKKLAAVEQLAGKHKLEIMFAMVPHSHLYALTTVVEASDTESGALEVGSAIAFAFGTSWSEGAFELYRDLDDGGRLVRVRVELGSPATVAREEQMSARWLGELAQIALVSGHVLDGGSEIRFLYRVEPANGRDSGWRMLASDEARDRRLDPEKDGAVPLRDLVAEDDEGFLELLATPAPCAFEWSDDEETFVQLDDFVPPTA